MTAVLHDGEWSQSYWWYATEGNSCHCRGEYSGGETDAGGGRMNKYTNPWGDGERDWWLALQWDFCYKE